MLVVGAGLCGLMCAYELIQRGVSGGDICIIDAASAGGETSLHSTGKLTAQHGLIYARLIEKFGFERALWYKRLNEHGVERAFEVAADIGAVGTVERADSYVYAEDGNQLERLKTELKAAERLGFDAELTFDCALPFPTVGALRFSCQATLNVGLFLNRLVGYIIMKGCVIFENTKALRVEKAAVVTDKGEIFAEKVIVSSRFPFADKYGLYFAKLYQQRAYMLAVETSRKINGMFIGAATSSLSLRPFGELLLICGGESENGEPYHGCRELTDRVSTFLQDMRVVAAWTAQDCMTHDKVPYIGRLERPEGEFFIATGFGKWGLSTSFGAAALIADTIVRGYSEEAAVFSPKRSVRAGLGSMFRHSAEIAGEFAVDAISVPHTRVCDLESGESAVAADGVKKVCACREGDTVRKMSHRCTHMNCPLKWNAGEGVWDCSCHGSRFSADGKVISGPAKDDLKYEN